MPSRTALSSTRQIQLLRDQERSRAIWHYVQDHRETLLRSLGTHAWCNANEKRNALVREGRKRFKLEADMVQARYLAKAVACRGPADSAKRVQLATAARGVAQPTSLAPQMEQPASGKASDASGSTTRDAPQMDQAFWGSGETSAAQPSTPQQSQTHGCQTPRGKRPSKVAQGSASSKKRKDTEQAEQAEQNKVVRTNTEQAELADQAFRGSGESGVGTLQILWNQSQRRSWRIVW